MELGHRIEERLAQLGVSQAELARRAGISQSTINSLIRRGRRSTPHLLKIARALETTPSFLTGETDDPKGDGPDDQPLTSDEAELLDHYRSIEPKERQAILTLARSIATNARSPTVHDRGRDFRGVTSQP